MANQVYYGADYYPEHWPRERWAVDIKLMQELGLDVVRLAEFSWQKLETSEGVFNFAWLDEAIDLLEAAGIKVVLGTPSAAPPAWLVEKDTSILPVDAEGRQVAFGGRHHACQSNKTLRKANRSYVKAFTKHFGEHPNVIGWQVDNELGNSHHGLCHCESCQKAFRGWLEARYDTIEALNDNWGTTFWSQGYNSFDQLGSPRWLVTGHNPSQVLDWRRFHSDLILDFHREQAEIVRKYAPGRWITHNMMGFADTVDYYKLAEQLDFASHDQYPGGHFRGPVENLPGLMAAELDMIRGTKQAPFWIMEQQSGITGWDVMGRAPKPGQLGLWSMQSVAHGADTIVYFRWRVAAMGTEQYWHGILPHSGIPGRNYAELQALIRRTRPLMGRLQGAMPNARVGLLFSYDQKYAMDIQRNNAWLNYQDHFQKIYNRFYERNIPVDVIGVGHDFSQYDVIVAPLQYLMSGELAVRYEAFVQAGGHLVLDMRAGVKHENNLNYTAGPLPGFLRNLLGITVPEYDPLLDSHVLVNWDNKSGKTSLWADIIELDSSSVRILATYDSEFYAGTPAVTANAFGLGEAIYIGTQLDTKLFDCVIDHLESRVDLGSLGITPPGLELCSRETASEQFLFALNHSADTQHVELDPSWLRYPAAAGAAADAAAQSYEIPPHSFEVFTRAK